MGAYDEMQGMTAEQAQPVDYAPDQPPPDVSPEQLAEESTPEPTLAAAMAPDGSLDAMHGMRAPLGRFQKYFDALSTRLNGQFEPKEEPTLDQRLGLFAMALANPAMARDVLQQRAQADLARQGRNSRLQADILSHSIRLGEDEMRAEDADRRYRLSLLRAAGMTARHGAGASRRAAVSAVGDLAAQVKDLRLRDAKLKLERAANDPQYAQRERYAYELKTRGLLVPGDPNADPFSPEAKPHYQRLSPDQIQAELDRVFPMPDQAPMTMAPDGFDYTAGDTGYADDMSYPDPSGDPTLGDTFAPDDGSYLDDESGLTVLGE